MSDVQRFVLWGSAGHALVLEEAIRRGCGKVVALFDNSPTATSVLPGVRLFGAIRELRQWTSETPDACDHRALVAIGGSRGRERLAMQSALLEVGFSMPPLIHPCAFVAENAIVGEGTQVLAGSSVAAAVSIGDACIVNHSASVDHECQIGDGVHIAPGATLCGCIAVGENSMIGAGATVLPRLQIGENSIVGAGAVVTRNVPANSVVVGIPASVVRTVDR
ncbi:sugar acetyltransferase [Rhodopirellula sp. SM50]|nr:sugar acetyltransferase [Rhodopirellula sp. SM50]